MIFSKSTQSIHYVTQCIIILIIVSVIIIVIINFIIIIVILIIIIVILITVRILPNLPDFLRSEWLLLLLLLHRDAAANCDHRQ